MYDRRGRKSSSTLSHRSRLRSPNPLSRKSRLKKSPFRVSPITCRLAFRSCSSGSESPEPQQELCSTRAVRVSACLCLPMPACLSLALSVSRLCLRMCLLAQWHTGDGKLLSRTLFHHRPRSLLPPKPPTPSSKPLPSSEVLGFLCDGRIWAKGRVSRS